MVAELKQVFSAVRWEDWLNAHKLVSFDAWWALQLGSVEEGNFDRGGWSSVIRFERDNRFFYVKRQSNRMTYRLTSFPIRVPTFKIEFNQIQRYQRHQIPTLEVVYFAWRKVGEEHQAILVTEALEDYRSLEFWLQGRETLSFYQRQSICQAVGHAVGKMHAAGIVHYNLYPKHIFMRLADFHIRFIDLETSRSNFGLRRKKLRDVETLGRRTYRASKSDKFRAFLAYQGKRKIDSGIRKDIDLMQQRSTRKLTQA